MVYSELRQYGMISPYNMQINQEIMHKKDHIKQQCEV